MGQAPHSGALPIVVVCLLCLMSVCLSFNVYSLLSFLLTMLGIVFIDNATCICTVRDKIECEKYILLDHMFVAKPI